MPTVDYDEAPLRPFHFRVALASSGGVFSDGYGLGIIGISLSHAAPQLGLGPASMGLLGGASLFGLFAGALCTGPVADRFGRRPIFAYNMALLVALSLLQAVANTSGQLMCLRLIIGAVLGTDYVVSKALLTEFTPGRVRGRICGLLSVAWAGGYACAYFVGFALGETGANSWRWMLLTSAVPCLLVLPLRITLPESPLWLVNHGFSEVAAAVVRKFIGTDVRLPSSTPVADLRRGRFKQLASRTWRLRTLVACAFFTCQVIPYFAVGTFVALVMSAMQLKSNYVGGLIYNGALLIGAIVGVLVVDRMARRTFLIGSFSIAAASLTVLCLWDGAPPIAMILLFAVFAGVLSAASNLVYVYLPELFPTDLRASGIGVAIAASRVGSAVSTFLLPVVVSAYSVRSALGGCVAVLVIGAVICLRWAPETKRLRLSALDASSAATAETLHCTMR